MCRAGQAGEGAKLSRGNYKDNDDEGNISPCVPRLCGVFVFSETLMAEAFVLHGRS